MKYLLAIIVIFTLLTIAVNHFTPQPLEGDVQQTMPDAVTLRAQWKATGVCQDAYTMHISNSNVNFHCPGSPHS